MGQIGGETWDCKEAARTGEGERSCPEGKVHQVLPLRPRERRKGDKSGQAFCVLLPGGEPGVRPGGLGGPHKQGF